MKIPLLGVEVIFPTLGQLGKAGIANYAKAKAEPILTLLFNAAVKRGLVRDTPQEKYTFFGALTFVGVMGELNLKKNTLFQIVLRKVLDDLASEYLVRSDGLERDLAEKITKDPVIVALARNVIDAEWRVV